MSDCLVLDMNYQPVGFCGWQKAVKLWYEDRAIIIKEDEGGRVLRSASFEMNMPRVIRVRNAWTRRKRLSVPFSRRNVAIRDNSACQYCGKVLRTEQYTLDHVVPRCQGGVSSWTNLVLACIRCNKHKSGMTPLEAGMVLLKQPAAPKTDDPKYTFRLHTKRLRKEWAEWQHWLYAEKASWAYWNTELEE